MTCRNGFGQREMVAAQHVDVLMQQGAKASHILWVQELLRFLPLLQGLLQIADILQCQQIDNQLKWVQVVLNALEMTLAHLAFCSAVFRRFGLPIGYVRESTGNAREGIDFQQQRRQFNVGQLPCQLLAQVPQTGRLFLGGQWAHPYVWLPSCFGTWSAVWWNKFSLTSV